MPATVRRKLCLAACLGPLLAGCTSYVQRPGGGLMPEAQSAGARVFVSRCSTCHDTPHPRRHDYATWRYLVGLMEQRMAERGVAPLTDAERSAILAYLKDNGR